MNVDRAICVVLPQSHRTVTRFASRAIIVRVPLREPIGHFSREGMLGVLRGGSRRHTLRERRYMPAWHASAGGEVRGAGG